MSDLSGKFGGLETQLATQHTEIINALNSIASALGAPPPGPTTTLADVVGVLEEQNVILRGIRTDMNGYLLEIFNTLDAMNNNASLNAQRTLVALSQLYCPCDPDAPLFPPPLDTTPISLDDQAKCKRVQFFTDMFMTYIIRIGDYVASGAAMSARALNDGLQGVLAGRDIDDGALRAGIPESVSSTAVDQIVNQMIIDGRPSFRFGLTDINTVETNRSLQLALYAATNAAEGHAAALAAIAASGINNKYAEICETLFYSAWANDIYSTTPVVDDSSYDGTICAPDEPQCFEFASVLCNMHHGPSNTNASVYGIAWTEPFAYSNSSLDGALTVDQPYWNRTDLYGYRVRCTIGACSINTATSNIHNVGSEEYTIETHTTEINMFNPNAPFTLEICEPL